MSGRLRGRGCCVGFRRDEMEILMKVVVVGRKQARVDEDIRMF